MTTVPIPHGVHAKGKVIFSSLRRLMQGVRERAENDCENRPSRNLPSLAVALNCGRWE